MLRHSFPRSFSLFVCLLIASLLPAQQLSDPIPMDPSVRTGKFANGLTYYVKHNPKPEQKVELRLMVKVGSIVEDDDQRGLAHFMEHMNFNGTKNFQKNELVDYLQSIGVEFGADLNAYTGFDQTVYILPIPTDKPGNLDKGFQILEDWAHNALLTEADIDAERGVVLEESRIGKGADQRMLDKYLPRFMAGSKYAERLPIGKDDILKNFNYETLRRFYLDWYRPDLQAVAVVGDIDTALAMQYLRKHFASIPAATNPRPRIYEKAGERKKSEAMVLTDKEASSARLLLLFPYRQKKEMKTRGDYREHIKRELVLNMLNTRLSERARGAGSPFPYAYMGYNDLIRGYENFLGVTIFGEAGPEKALNALVEELIRAQKFGFNEDELQLAGRNMLAGVENLYNGRNTAESGEMIDEYIRHFLDSEPVPGIEKEYAWYQQFIPGIPLAEVNKLVKSISGPSNVFSLITAPDKPELKLPDAAGLQRMTANALKQDVKPAVKKTLTGELLSEQPVTGTILGQESDAALQTTTYSLSNGIKVTVKSTDFKDDEILLSGVKKGGYNNYDLKDRNDARFATDIVEAMGLGNYSPTDLEKVLAGKTASVSMSISEIQSSISGNCNVKDFETMFQLLHLSITQPRLDPELAETHKSSQTMMYSFLSASPEFAFLDTTYKRLYNNSPQLLSPIPKPADFEAINPENAYAIYRKEFGSADGYHFFLVGKIDMTVLPRLLMTYLAGIPSNNVLPSFRDNGLRPVTGSQTFIFKKGSEPKSMISGYYHGEVPFSEDMNLKIRAASEILNIKIIEELREKLSAIYGGQIGAYLSKDPYPHYEAIVALPCGPENVDTLITALNTEITKMIEKGPDDKDLEKVKTTFHEQYRTKIKENGYWLSRLAGIYTEGYSVDNFLQYDARVDRLTKADVQEAARLVFGGKDRFFSILYPETN